VGIPFAVFTKPSIKLGVSLWMGIINENPRMSTRVLMEIASNWENTVRRGVGIFDGRFRHADPFFLKKEFAPSDKATLLKRQQAALSLVSPHLRILQFLVSHFNATRLGSPHIERGFHRLVRITLAGLKQVGGHPLAREIHFHIILFALNFLRFSTGLDAPAQAQLKEQIMSAALRWFASFPEWSFGGNRLQVKAETHLLADVEDAVHAVAHIGLSSPQGPTMARAKQELLLALIHNELERLMVWLYPLDQERKLLFSARTANTPNEVRMQRLRRLMDQPQLTEGKTSIAPLVRIAWDESPGLALQLIKRFPFPRLVTELRWLLLNYPQRAMDEPDALQILLGSSLPNDVTFQLKVRPVPSRC
jgi:phosphatidylinositol 4-kinase